MDFEDHDNPIPEDRYERALMLQGMMIVCATGGGLDESLYQSLRGDFMADPVTKGLLPQFVRSHRTFDALWGYFKSVSGQWQPRREHVYEAFRPILDELEGLNRSPADVPILETLSAFDTGAIHSIWEKALDRRIRDPEGAITLAKTLLETVCKHIIEDCGGSYPSNADLPKLYHQAAEHLNLAPTQHNEEVFRAILGSCQQVVNSLGTLRNRMGDAHGSGRQPVRPHSRHAALAVNLAGSMATFLVETWLVRKDE